MVFPSWLLPTCSCHACLPSFQTFSSSTTPHRSLKIVASHTWAMSPENTLGERSNLSISTAAMHRLLLLLISCLLSLTSALSIPCPSNPQPGSTSCQVLDDATQTLDGPIAVVGSKPNVLENRGRPIPIHAEEGPLRMLTHRYEPSGTFTSRDDGEMGPYRLPAGTYQIHIRWIDQFIPGTSKPHPTAPPFFPLQSFTRSVQPWWRAGAVSRPTC